MNGNDVCGEQWKSIPEHLAQQGMHEPFPNVLINVFLIEDYICRQKYQLQLMIQHDQMIEFKDFSLLVYIGSTWFTTWSITSIGSWFEPNRICLRKYVRYSLCTLNVSGITSMDENVSCGVLPGGKKNKKTWKKWTIPRMFQGPSWKPDICCIIHIPEHQ